MIRFNQHIHQLFFLNCSIEQHFSSAIFHNRYALLSTPLLQGCLSKIYNSRKESRCYWAFDKMPFHCNESVRVGKHNLHKNGIVWLRLFLYSNVNYKVIDGHQKYCKTVHVHSTSTILKAFNYVLLQI